MILLAKIGQAHFSVHQIGYEWLWMVMVSSLQELDDDPILSPCLLSERN